jgi:hypothetical protein
MGGRQAGHSGQVPHGEGLGVPGVGQVLGPQQVPNRWRLSHCQIIACTAKVMG